MKILGIDSSTDRLGIGLADENQILAESLLDSMREHASRIVGMIDDVLKRGNIEKSELEGIAVALGPGSFTGLRVGLAVAKGLSFALKIPIVGISTFEVISQRLIPEYPKFALSSIVRKGELFLYRHSESSKIPDDIIIISQDELAVQAGDIPVGMIGREPDNWRNTFSKTIDASKTCVSGGELAQIGTAMIRDNKFHDSIELEPLYIAPSQAEEKFGRK
ncbi:MAG: tRNA (adenosine(37)-N6)-threonylcarbamoyltransferase complex dimerization subunit type 1 TsaB [candidate division Zixibacteria bacterium]|nr:tRNA (adenosine(37)-N6)-threonylcarbamoyltransferase complex dimerization subunit type 1 TsaB [candidate division Zixibacteria bacterium]